MMVVDKRNHIVYHTPKELEAAGLLNTNEKATFWNGKTIAFVVAANAFLAFIYFGLPIVLR